MIRLVWWANPLIIFPVLVLGSSLVTFALPESTYGFWGTSKYFDLRMLVIAVGAVIMFRLGTLAAIDISTKSVATYGPSDQKILAFLADIAFVLTLFGYVAWGYFARQRGLSLGVLMELLLDPEAGASDRVKESMQTVSGVTTFTQFGLICMILTCLQLFGAWESVKFRFKFYFVALLGLAFVRSVANSERLALIELMVPAVILFVSLSEACTRGVFKRLVSLGPVFAVAALLVIFGVFEYFRSWQYYQADFDSFPLFVVSRIASYFCTALNNSALMFYMGDLPPWPYWTLEFFWRFPLIANSDYSYFRITGQEPIETYMYNLEAFGTPELNNHSGLMAPLLDYSYGGFAVYWFLFGALSGFLTRQMQAGRLIGLIFFPILFVAILETPRIVYLTSHRTFPSLFFGLGCLIAVNLVRSRRR